MTTGQINWLNRPKATSNGFIAVIGVFITKLFQLCCQANIIQIIQHSGSCTSTLHCCANILPPLFGARCNFNHFRFIWKKLDQMHFCFFQTFTSTLRYWMGHDLEIKTNMAWWSARDSRVKYDMILVKIQGEFFKGGGGRVKHRPWKGVHKTLYLWT